MPLGATLIVGLAAGLLRNVAGWIENSFEDGKLLPYEWLLLLSTVVKTLLLTVGLAYTFDMEPLAAGASALLTNVALTKVGKIGK